MSPTVFDPGLQPERTRLAWRRTTAGLAVGGALALRILPRQIGPWAYALGFTCLCFAVLVAALASRRAWNVNRALSQGTPLPGGIELAFLAAAVSGATLLVILGLGVGTW